MISSLLYCCFRDDHYHAHEYSSYVHRYCDYQIMNKKKLNINLWGCSSILDIRKLSKQQKGHNNWYTLFPLYVTKPHNIWNVSKCKKPSNIGRLCRMRTIKLNKICHKRILQNNISLLVIIYIALFRNYLGIYFFSSKIVFYRQDFKYLNYVFKTRFLLMSKRLVQKLPHEQRAQTKCLFLLLGIQ